MAVAKEPIRQIISENNLSSVADVYVFLWDSFKDILHASMSFSKPRWHCVPL